MEKYNPQVEYLVSQESKQDTSKGGGILNKIRESIESSYRGIKGVVLAVSLTVGAIAGISTLETGCGHPEATVGESAGEGEGERDSGFEEGKADVPDQHQLDASFEDVADNPDIGYPRKWCMASCPLKKDVCYVVNDDGTDNCEDMIDEINDCGPYERGYIRGTEEDIYNYEESIEEILRRYGVDGLKCIAYSRTRSAVPIQYLMEIYYMECADQCGDDNDWSQNN